MWLLAISSVDDFVRLMGPLAPAASAWNNICALLSLFFSFFVTIITFRLRASPHKALPQILASGCILHQLFLISSCQPRSVWSLPIAYHWSTEIFLGVFRLDNSSSSPEWLSSRTWHLIVRHILCPLCDFISDSIKTQSNWKHIGSNTDPCRHPTEISPSMSMSLRWLLLKSCS